MSWTNTCCVRIAASHDVLHTFSTRYFSSSVPSHLPHPPPLPHALLAISQRSTRGSEVNSAEVSTARLNAFWTGRRNTTEMEAVYAGLLRSGKGERVLKNVRNAAESDYGAPPSAATAVPQAAVVASTAPPPVEEEAVKTASGAPTKAA